MSTLCPTIDFYRHCFRFFIKWLLFYESLYFSTLTHQLILFQTSRKIGQNIDRSISFDFLQIISSTPTQLCCVLNVFKLPQEKPGNEKNTQKLVINALSPLLMFCKVLPALPRNLAAFWKKNFSKSRIKFFLLEKLTKFCTKKRKKTKTEWYSNYFVKLNFSEALKKISWKIRMVLPEKLLLRVPV